MLRALAMVYGGCSAVLVFVAISPYPTWELSGLVRGIAIVAGLQGLWTARQMWTH